MTANRKFNLGLMGAPDPAQYDERFENWPGVTAAQWWLSSRKHNVYHCGQIVVIRRLIGAWQEKG